MAEDVIIHGDFVQFNGAARCQACQGNNVRCALHQNDEGCIGCAGASRECLFTRSITVSGPKSRFDWNTLLNRSQVQIGVAARTPASSVAFTPRVPMLDHIPNEQPIDQQAKYDVPVERFLPQKRPTESLLNTPYRAVSQSTNSPKTEGPRPRTGVNPSQRQPLGEIMSLTQQTQELDLVKTNARVGQWLDQCVPGSSVINEADEVEEVHRNDLSPIGGSKPNREENERANPSSEVSSASEIDRAQHFAATSPMSGRGRPRHSPTLEAHPWTDISRIPHFGKDDAQPFTANDAIVRFSQYAKATEEASHCASNGSHYGIKVDRTSNFPPKYPQSSPTFSNLIDHSDRSTMSRAAFVDDLPSMPTTSVLQDPTHSHVSGYTPYRQAPPRLLPREHPKFKSSQPSNPINPPPRSRSATMNDYQDNQRNPMPLSPRSSGSQPIIKPSATETKPRSTTQIVKLETADPCDTFEDEIRTSNPDIPEFLLKRLTQEQSRRYKRMIGLKAEHFELARQEQCPSGSLCVEGKYSNGSGAGIFSGMDVVKSLKQVQYTIGDREGSVDLTSLSPSYPLPPTQGLPSEFECPFCFKVKKCLKPSDWAKHFCEDLQPFVCTFESCTDPKSFKRKADWIRHENERHRQLERWVCNIIDCTHICYRKDNFVQHLVREHKMPEPKPRADSRSTRVPYYRPSDLESLNREDSVWTLVEECREEEPKSPKDEPCKFCNTVCNSWKKLSNHLAKHMEDIAFPVWKVVLQTDVSGATPRSPSDSAVPPQPAFPPFKDPPIREPPAVRRVSSKSEHGSVGTGGFEASVDPEPDVRPVPIPQLTSHFATVNKPYRCEEPGCTHDRGFATQTDLKRHRKGVHGIYDDGHNDQTFYRCQGRDCKDADKMWPRRDNFRGHLSRKHADEDIEDLTERSTVRPPNLLSPILSTNSAPPPPEPSRNPDSPPDSRNEVPPLSALVSIPIPAQSEKTRDAETGEENSAVHPPPPPPARDGGAHDDSQDPEGVARGREEEAADIIRVTKTNDFKAF